MKKKQTVPGSIVACVSKRDGVVLKVGAVSRMFAPALVAPFQVAFGAACGDWRVCVYLTITDAARLTAELGRLIDEHTDRD